MSASNTEMNTWEEQFKNVIESMKNELNIIVMGPAGTGKSYMINEINKQFKIILTSSTGTSACNIYGCTTDNLLHLHGKKN